MGLALLSTIPLTTLAPTRAEPLYLTEDQEMDLRIVELRLRKRAVLSSDILAYGDGGDILLPLSDIVFALGFQIDVDVATGTASGWFLRETQNFTLDTEAGTVSIAGTELTFSPENVRTDGADIYVPLRLLSLWFELNSDWDSQTQSVNLEPAYLLISEEQAQRLRRTPTSGKRGAKFDVNTLERVNAPYGWIGYPHGSADFSLNMRSGQTDSTTGQANLALTGDLFKMTGELFLSGSTEGQKNARLTLGRTDAGGRLFSPALGNFGATQFRMGDISTSSNPILESGGSGLGLSLARKPLRQTGDFDTTRLEGDAFPGWQAELYRDGQLLGVLTIPESGRYLFDDVPLTFGINRFRIELYGPSGERRTIDRPVDVSNSFIRNGDIQYTLELASLGRGLFTNRQDEAEIDFDDDGTTTATTDTTLDRQNGGYVGYAEVAFGVSKTVSGAAGIQLRGGETNRNTQTGFVSVARRDGASILTSDLAIDNYGDHAFRFGYSTEVRGISVSANVENRSKGFGLRSNNTNTASNVTNRANLRLDGRFKPPGLKREAGWSVSTSASERTNGTIGLSAQGRLSGQIGNLSLNQNFNWRMDEKENSERTETATSTFNLSGTLGKLRIRGGLELDIHPGFQARSGQIELSRRIDNWYARARFAREFDDTSDILGIGLTRDFKGVRIGGDVRYTFDTNETIAVLSLGFDIDRHPNSNALRFGRDARSDRGVAKVRVYEDLDLDGVFSEKDQLIENAAIIVEPRARLLENERLIVLDDLSTDQIVGIKVDKDQLQDPYLVPASDGVSFTPRPAATVEIDLPVVMSGELEVFLSDGSGNPREGVIAELQTCDRSSPPIRERAAYDGYIFFQFIKPGCYQLSVPGIREREIQIEPGAVERLSFRQYSIRKS